MIRFGYLIILALSILATLAHADDPARDKSAPPPSSADTEFTLRIPAGRIVLRASNPSVQQIMKRHDAANAGGARPASQPPQKPTASRFNSSASGVSTQPANSELIKLEVPDDQPEVVNRSKSFVFKNITRQNRGPIDSTRGLRQRQQQIELLRRAGKS